ncbi:ABC transporter ATP-binding protein [Bacillus sp. 03113]|uniref:ABC transporter ATP-binding protein n=1 Tax=Bacillus sp. 03113 TaxID=2578211 RepID=UPI001144D034|nr:ABC transporter ATP-binding protein [Bacillus sp. 03113]
MEISIRDLTKTYGQKVALDRVSLTIHKGMFGLLGKNGAGKTTIMRILVTLIPPSSGEVMINGIPISERTKVRSIIGYLPQNFSIYPSFNVYESLDYLGILSGLSDNRKRKKRISELLDKVNLTEAIKTKSKNLSGGMLRRLGIAQALLADPQVLIVDEPTVGLDPEERIRFRNMLSDLAEDRIVLLSTHIVEDIEATCDQLAILDSGKLVYGGGIKDLLIQAQDYVWTATIDHEMLEQIKKQDALLSAVAEGDGFKVRLLSKTIPFAGAKKVKPSIEDAYMKVIRGMK